MRKILSNMVLGLVVLWGAWVMRNALLDDSLSEMMNSASASPRIGHTSTLIGQSLILVYGGDNATVPAEVYDTKSGQFSSVYNVPEIAYHSDVVIPTGGVLLVSTLDKGLFYWARFVEEIPMNHHRAYPSASLLDTGEVIAIGGINRGVPVPTTELYDPSTKSFSSHVDMLYPRYYHKSLKLSDGTVLVLGGRNQAGLVREAELYNPTTQSFSYAGEFPATSSLTATVLPNDNVLVVTTGGLFLWDKFAREFQYISSALGLYGHTATLYGNRVLIVGGKTGVPTVDSIYEIDTNTLQVTQIGQLDNARAFHTATLVDDKLYIIGGIDYPSPVMEVETIALYQPPTPEHTPYPTYTPLPTLEPLSTLVPLPTYTPLPTLTCSSVYLPLVTDSAENQKCPAIAE